MGFFLQTEEFQHQRIFDQLARGLRQVALVGQTRHPFLVPTKSEPFIQAGFHLTLERAQIPAMAGSFYFIEHPFFRVGDAHKKNIMRPAN